MCWTTWRNWIVFPFDGGQCKKSNVSEIEFSLFYLIGCQTLRPYTHQIKKSSKCAECVCECDLCAEQVRTVWETNAMERFMKRSKCCVGYSKGFFL